MKKDKNIYVWERLSEYLDDKMKDFVIDVLRWLRRKPIRYALFAAPLINLEPSREDI